MRRKFAELSLDQRAVGVIALLMITGLALRLALLMHAGWRYDYDEGMVGLQVLHILDGARPVFHPGQPYLAALESYLIAPLFWAFGANAVTLKIVPWLLSGAVIAETGWIGWRAFDRQTGVISALLAACAPLYLLVTGMKTWGATAETLFLGGAALIAASYVIDPTQTGAVRRRAVIALALTGGVAFWVSWLIAFYAVPVLIMLLCCGRDVLRRNTVWIMLAFFAGSAPFWIYNLQHDWATFHYLLGDQGITWTNTRRVLDHLNYDLAPRLVSGDPAWHILSWPAIWWLQIVYEGGLIALIIAAWRGPWTTHKRPIRALLALFAALLPVIYVASGYGNHALNPFGFDATGRYVLMIHNVLPVGVAALVVILARRRAILRLPAAAILTSVIGLNLLGTIRADPVQVFVSPYYTRQPATLEPLIDFLDKHDIRHVWTDVGVAHVLMFETGKRILAADWYDIYGAKGILRFPDVPEQIAEAERVAFVEVVLLGQTNTRFEQAFTGADIPHDAYRVAPTLLVIIPHTAIDPALVDDGLGYQF